MTKEKPATEKTTRQITPEKTTNDGKRMGYTHPTNKGNKSEDRTTTSSTGPKRTENKK